MTFKLHSLKIHVDGGSAAIITDLLDIDEQLNATLNAEITAPFSSPNHVAYTGRKPVVSGSTYDLTGMLNKIGVSGLGISGAVNPGVVVYGQNFDNNSFPVTGAYQRSLTYALGVLVPKSLTCEHQGDAKLAFDLVVIGDGTNAPVVISTTATLPTITQLSSRWTLGPVMLGGIQFDEYHTLNIDFGNTVETKGVQSHLDDTHVEVKTHAPKITLTGIDVGWFGASKVPIGGLVIANATDSIYLAKRTQTETSFVPNVTAEHIKFGLAGLSAMGQLNRGQAQRIGESTVMITLATDVSGNAPLTLSTASAIT